MVIIQGQDDVPFPPRAESKKSRNCAVLSANKKRQIVAQLNIGADQRYLDAGTRPEVLTSGIAVYRASISNSSLMLNLA